MARLRAEASGVVQVLLVAILLQLAVLPFVANAAMPVSGPDLVVCTSTGIGTVPADHPEPAFIHPAHCPFCLPLLSQVAASAAEFAVAAPGWVHYTPAIPPTPWGKAAPIAKACEARAPPSLSRA